MKCREVYFSCALLLWTEKCCMDLDWFPASCFCIIKLINIPTTCHLCQVIDYVVAANTVRMCLRWGMWEANAASNHGWRCFPTRRLTMKSEQYFGQRGSDHPWFGVVEETIACGAPSAALHHLLGERCGKRSRRDTYIAQASITSSYSSYSSDCCNLVCSLK